MLVVHHLGPINWAPFLHQCHPVAHRFTQPPLYRNRNKLKDYSAHADVRLPSRRQPEGANLISLEEEIRKKYNTKVCIFYGTYMHSRLDCMWPIDDGREGLRAGAA